MTALNYLVTVLGLSPHHNMPSENTKKRKQPLASNPTAQAPKRRKIQTARAIAVQTNDKALKNGELDVSAFVKAREYEIKALESSLGNAKKALSTRAFQSVPRSMRRRTASHNVKKVPKRLRARAAKEVCLTLRGGGTRC